MKKTLIAAAALVAVVLWLWWWLQPEQVVERRTRSLIGFVDLGKVSGVGVVDTHALGRLIAPELRVEADFVADVPVTVIPAEVEMAYRWLGDKASRSEFELVELQRVHVDGDKATLSARIRGRLELEQRRLVEGEYQVDFEWQRTPDGAWRLRAMSWE